MPAARGTIGAVHNPAITLNILDRQGLDSSLASAAGLTTAAVSMNPIDPRLMAAAKAAPRL